MVAATATKSTGAKAPATAPAASFNCGTATEHPQSPQLIAARQYPGLPIGNDEAVRITDFEMEGVLYITRRSNYKRGIAYSPAIPRHVANLIFDVIPASVRIRYDPDNHTEYMAIFMHNTSGVGDRARAKLEAVGIRLLGNGSTRGGRRSISAVVDPSKWGSLVEEAVAA